jgi:hypothetical protein
MGPTPLLPSPSLQLNTESPEIDPEAVDRSRGSLRLTILSECHTSS